MSLPLFPIGLWGARSTLWDGLSVGYHLDEASGVALAFDTNGPNVSLNLTDTNTVTSAAGQCGGARQFTAASNERFTHADDAAFRAGDISYAWSAWAKLDSKNNGRVIVAKLSGGVYEYQLYHSNAFQRWSFYSGGQEATASAFGVVPLGVWHHLYAQYDSVANLLGISVNNTTMVTAALANGVSTAGAFYMGYDGISGSYFDGALDEVLFWKNRVLTVAERAENYANGLAGRAL